MATVAQLHANRANAQCSTGPRSATGKARASRNAQRHGLFSQSFFTGDDEAALFAEMFADLERSLHPVGALEASLVERIAVGIWRQRRLNMAEGSMLRLRQSPAQIAKQIRMEHRYGLDQSFEASELEPFDTDHANWCQTVLSEIEGLEEISLACIAREAPKLYEQLTNDAEDSESLDAFLSHHLHGLTSYVGELEIWCRKELLKAEKRPALLAVADEFRTKGLLLPAVDLLLLSRYQTMLDNQLFKAFRAFREAQDWRLKALDGQADELSGIVDLIGD